MFGEQFAILVVEGEFEGFGVDLDAVDEVGFTEQVEDWCDMTPEGDHKTAQQVFHSYLSTVDPHVIQ